MKRFWNWLGEERNRARVAFLGAGLATLVGGAWTMYLHFQPRFPEEPIQIDLNVKIDHKLNVKLDKDVEDAFAADQAIF